MNPYDEVSGWVSVENTKAINGTSLIGITSLYTFSQVRAVLGEPLPLVDVGDGKISTEWLMRRADGAVVTVYDWKETNLYDDDLPSVEEFRARKSSYNWHVGGHSTAHANEFLEWLQAEMEKTVSPND